MAAIATLTSDFSTMPSFLNDNFGTVAIVDGQASLAVTPGYSGIKTAGTYDGRGSSTYIKITPRHPRTGSYETLFYWWIDSANYVEFYVSGATFQGSVRKGGVNTYVALAGDTYDPVAHAWWRIREAGGTVYFDTAPDGGTWTQRGSLAHTLDLSAVSFEVATGHWAAEAAVADTLVDNLNITPPSASSALSGLTDTFPGTALAAEWTASGAGVADSQLYVNASHNAGVGVYSSARSRPAYTWSGSSLLFEAVAMPGPAGGSANAQMWVMDSAPAATVDRLGFEYVASANRLDLLGQSGASYTAIGTTTSLTYDPVAHRWLRINHTGSSIVWQTSPDGLTWTTQRTLTSVPSWANKTTLRVSFEAYRTAGTNDTFRVDNVNTPLPSPATLAATPADALQQRTLNELTAWKQWLTTNNARGWVGEYGWVTLWTKYNDPTQGAKWAALGEAYQRHLEVTGLSGTVWAGGREWGQGYPLGTHVGANVGDPLTIANTDAATVISGHRSRGGQWRGVNLAGHERGMNIAGGGTIRTDTPLIHTAADFGFLAASGVDLVRLPVAWERLQPTLGAALDTAALTALDGMLLAARQVGIRVVIDLHNYGRYTQANGTVVALGGSLTNAQFNDFWTRLSTWVRASVSRSSNVIGYGLMNEPNALTGGAATWQTASQAAVTAIRQGGDNRLILVGGYTFSSLTEWATWHPTGWITDPANNFAYEAHHYWDTQSALGARSGTYQQAKAGGGTEILTYSTELDSAGPPPRVNLCTNPSLETNATGYTVASARSGVTTFPVVGAAAARSNTITAVSGTWYGYVNVTGTGTTSTTPDVEITLPTFPVTPGLRYTVSYHRQTNSGGGTDRLELRWLDSTGAEISVSSGSQYAVTTSFTNRAWLNNHQAPAGAVTCQPRLAYFAPADTTVRSYRWDALLYEQTNALQTYFDGTTAGASWDGTAHASTSRLPVSTTGVDHVQTVTDTTLTDDVVARAAAFTQAPVDTAALSDTSTSIRNILTTIADTVPADDTTAMAVGYERYPVDPLDLTDSTTSAAQLSRPQEDTVPVADSIAGGANRSHEETDLVDVVDEINYLLGADVRFEDALAVDDTTEPEANYSQETSDSVDVVDDPIRVAGFHRDTVDPATLEDSVEWVRGLSSEVTDTTSVTDEIASATVARTATIVDDLTVADSVIQIAPATRSFTERVTTGDSVDITTRGRVTMPAEPAVETDTAPVLPPSVSTPLPVAVETDTTYAPARVTQANAPRTLETDTGVTPRPTGSYPTEQAGEWDMTFPPIVLVDDGEFGVAIDDAERVPVYVLKADWNRNGLYDHPLSDLTSLVNEVSVSKALSGTLPAEIGRVEGYSSAELSVRLVGEISTVFNQLDERRNLVINPSFESNTIGWSSNGEHGASLPREQAVILPNIVVAPRSGSWHAYTRRLTPGTLDVYPSSLSAVTPGATYTGSIYVNGGGATTPRLDIQWHDSAGTFLSSTVGTTAAPPEDTWTHLLTTGTAPGNAASGRIVVRAVNQPAEVYIRYDAAVFERRLSPAAGAYFDGNSPGARWVGTVNNSVSIREGVDSATLSETGREFDVVDAFAPYRPDSPLYGYPVLQTPIYLETGFLADDGPRLARRFTGTVAQISPQSAARVVELRALDPVARLRATVTLSAVAMYEALLTRWGPDQYRSRMNSQWLIDHALRRNGIYTSPPCRDNAILSVTGHGSMIPEIGWGGAPEEVYAAYRADVWQQGRFGGALCTRGGPTGRWWLTEELTAASGTGFGFSQWMATYPVSTTGAQKQYFSLDLTTDASWFINFGVDTSGRPYLGSQKTGTAEVRAVPTGYTPPTSVRWAFVGVHVVFTATQMTVRFRIDQTTYTSTVTIGSRPGNWKPGVHVRYSWPGAFQNFQLWKSATVPGTPWQGEDPNWVPQADLDPGVNEFTGIPDLLGVSSWELIKAVTNAEGSTFQFDEYGRPQFRTTKGDLWYGRSKTVRETISADRNLADLVSVTDESSIRNVINLKTKTQLIGDWEDFYVSPSVDAFDTPAQSTSYFEIDLPSAAYEIPPALSTFGCLPYIPNCWAYAGGTGFIYCETNEQWSKYAKERGLARFPRVMAVNANNPTQISTFGGQIRIVRLTPWKFQIIINNQRDFPLRWSTASVINQDGSVTEGEPAFIIPARLVKQGPEQLETYTDHGSVNIYGASSFDVGGGDDVWRQTPHGLRAIASEVLSNTASPVPVLDAVSGVPHDPRRRLTDRVVLRDPDGLGQVTGSIVELVQTYSSNGASDQVTVRPVDPPR